MLEIPGVGNMKGILLKMGAWNPMIIQDITKPCCTFLSRENERPLKSSHALH
jgi:hypothetical protein